MSNSKNIRSIFESGHELAFKISTVKKLAKRGNNIWRATCSVNVSYSIDGNETSIDFEKVRCSGLASFNLLTKKEDFVGKEFKSYSTSPLWKQNPFKIVKSEGKYYLYMVHEKGRKYVEQIMPGGEIVPKCLFLYYEPKDYVRFLDCDMLKERQSQKEESNANG